jgi:hypothetical protein
VVAIAYIFPFSPASAVATAMMGHLPEDVQYKILRGNAIKMLHLDMK